MGIFDRNYYKLLRKKGYDIGDYTYIGRETSLCAADKIKIGKFSCIGNRVLLNPAMHPMDWLSVHPFQYKRELDFKLYGNMPANTSSIDFEECPKKIEIGSDVWICENAIILGGVTIGDGAVIGAGTVVTKDIPPYAVAVGNPAKVKRYRFEQNIIERLIKSQWWHLPYSFIQTLPFNRIEECLNLIEKYRQDEISG